MGMETPVPPVGAAESLVTRTTTEPRLWARSSVEECFRDMEEAAGSIPAEPTQSTS
jgi:hypothetical protein